MNPASAEPAAGTSDAKVVEPATSLADVLPMPVQASLFVLLVAFLGVMGWTTIRPSSSREAEHLHSFPAKVDLNRADRSELLLLRGVGQDMADRIVAYRQLHGPFEGLADLRKVPGIGPTTLEKLRPQVMLSWANPPLEKAPATPSIPVFEPAVYSLKSAIRSDALLDPNHATLEELQTLPGIGPVLAKRLVEARSLKPFSAVGDLRRVPGIGPKTLDKLKSRLRFGTNEASDLTMQ